MIKPIQGWLGLQGLHRRVSKEPRFLRLADGDGVVGAFIGEPAHFFVKRDETGKFTATTTGDFENLIVLYNFAVPLRASTYIVVGGPELLQSLLLLRFEDAISRKWVHFYKDAGDFRISPTAVDLSMLGLGELVTVGGMYDLTQPDVVDEYLDYLNGAAVASDEEHDG